MKRFYEFNPSYKTPNVKNARHLTVEEECDILNRLDPLDFIGCGSSRAVYRFDEHYVAKVAVSLEGMNQNKIEIERSEDDARGYFNSRLVARIVAFGHTLVISEYVKPYKINRQWEFEQILETIDKEKTNYWEGARPNYPNYNPKQARDNAIKIAVRNAEKYGFKDWADILSREDELDKMCLESAEMQEAIEDKVEELNDYFGDTSDNNQVGFLPSGEIVAYDYGYLPEADDDFAQVGDMDNWMDAGMCPLSEAYDLCKTQEEPDRWILGSTWLGYDEDEDNTGYDCTDDYDDEDDDNETDGDCSDEELRRIINLT